MSSDLAHRSLVGRGLDRTPVRHERSPVEEPSQRAVLRISERPRESVLLATNAASRAERALSSAACKRRIGGIVAIGEWRSRWAAQWQEHDLGARRFGGGPKVSLPHAAAGLIGALLLLATCGTAFAQDEATASSLPVPAAPPTPQGREEESATPEEQRPLRPFFLPQVAPTARLIPDATSDLNSSVLLPLNAFEGLRPSDKAIQVGDFAVSSRIAAGATYDDNTNATKSDRKDDILTFLQGSVRADSQFKRHSLGFQLSAAVEEPDRNPGSNLDDRITVASGVNGRLDLTRRSSLAAEAQVTRGAQDPEAQEAGAEEEPTILTAAGAVAFTQQLDRLGWEIGGALEREEAVSGGDSAGEQDRTSYTIAPGLDYELSRRLDLFTEAGYTRNRYDNTGQGGSRDSREVDAEVGVDLELGRTFALRLGIGYLAVFFDDSERGDQHSPTFTADLTGAINLDRLTVLGVGLNHSTDQTTADDAALVTRTRFSSSINRLLSPASAIVARVEFERSDFIDESRTDYDIIAELAYSQTLFRNVALDVSYRFSQRFSDDEEDEFYRNVVSIGLSASF